MAMHYVAPLVCEICGQPLEGRDLECALPSDEQHFCRLCEITVGDPWDEQMKQPWYGVAPHTHDLSKTGGYVGSTVLTELPPPNENGDIDLGWAIFTPDTDCEGLGTYHPK